MRPVDSLTVAEVSRVLDVDPRQVAYAIERGRLKAEQWEHNAHRYILRDELRRFAQSAGLRVLWDALTETGTSGLTGTAVSEPRNDQEG